MVETVYKKRIVEGELAQLFLITYGPDSSNYTWYNIGMEYYGEGINEEKEMIRISEEEFLELASKHNCLTALDELPIPDSSGS